MACSIERQHNSVEPTASSALDSDFAEPMRRSCSSQGLGDKPLPTGQASTQTRLSPLGRHHCRAKTLQESSWALHSDPRTNPRLWEGKSLEPGRVPLFVDITGYGIGSPTWRNRDLATSLYYLFAQRAV